VEYKSLSIELKAGDAGVIEGYGSVFGGVDTYGDTIAPGAFAKSIAQRRPKMLWQHRMDMPIGRWDEYAEDSRGLHMRGTLAINAPSAREKYELVKAGALDGLSIGFRAINPHREGNVRVLTEIDLVEVSLVTMPADEAALLSSVKSVRTIRDLETILETVGFSRTEARAICARGWTGFADRLRDAAGDDHAAPLWDAEAFKAAIAMAAKEAFNDCR